MFKTAVKGGCLGAPRGWGGCHERRVNLFFIWGFKIGNLAKSYKESSLFLGITPEKKYNRAGAMGRDQNAVLDQKLA